MTSWHGSGRSSRDFQIGTVGVEVKTTRKTSSEHRIQGPYQVEPGTTVTGGVESHLYLFSVGIQEATDGSSPSWTLPGLVDGILDRLAADTQVIFLDQLHAYGAGDVDGYDHHDLAHRIRFGHAWALQFARLYDMSDPKISLLRTADLAHYKSVVPQSIEYTVKLPEHVTGAINPIHGLHMSANHVLRRALGPDSATQRLGPTSPGARPG